MTLRLLFALLLLLPVATLRAQNDSALYGSEASQGLYAPLILSSTTNLSFELWLRAEVDTILKLDPGNAPARALQQSIR